jgi:hypothetical protein
VGNICFCLISIIISLVEIRSSTLLKPSLSTKLSLKEHITLVRPGAEDDIQGGFNTIRPPAEDSDSLRLVDRLSIKMLWWWFVLFSLLMWLLLWSRIDILEDCLGSYLIKGVDLCVVLDDAELFWWLWILEASMGFDNELPLLLKGLLALILRESFVALL